MIMPSPLLFFLLSSLPFLNAFTTPTLHRTYITPRHKHTFLTNPATTNNQNARKQTTTTTIFMGWGPDPIWSSAKILECIPACSNSVSVKLQVPSEVSEGYTVPGQYLQLKNEEEGKPLFLAVASPPPKSEEDGSILEFLIKKTDSNQWVTEVDGGEVEVISSQVMGGGFKTEEHFEGFKYDFPTQNVILCATGSGIAPVRAVIESGALNLGESSGRTGRLYYGCRTFEDMAYTERFEKWEELGVEVVPILSQPELSSMKWDGRAGYVQTALEEDGIPIPRNSGAVMCGVKGMTEAVSDILKKSGVFEGRILTNF